MVGDETALPLFSKGTNMTEYAGIDYGMGRVNIDNDTGIRYGVISQHEVTQSWADSSEPDYGKPHCPKCGNEATAGESRNEQRENGVTCWTEHPEHTEDWECDGCGDYRCDDCEYLFDGDRAFRDEPLGFTLDDGEYLAEQSGDDGDIFILKSPYYTRCQFCSPCAPGAGYLMNPCEDGPKAYCFGPDWFEDGKCPYDVYSVETGEKIHTAPEEV